MRRNDYELLKFELYEGSILLLRFCSSVQIGVKSGSITLKNNSILSLYFPTNIWQCLTLYLHARNFSRI